MCNVSPQNRPEFPVVLKSDAAYIVIMILFSVSNGYIASISMMSAPQVGDSRSIAIRIKAKREVSMS